MHLNEPYPAAYCGELIDIKELLREMGRVAEKTGWKQDVISVANENLPRRVDAVAFRRQSRFPSHRIYLSSGIHGDEPAGPVAILELMKTNRWPENVEIWICPCLNLSGFLFNRRENLQGMDLDRDYRKQETEEVRTHVSWLKRKPNFDVTLCLREDHAATGFYIHESNPDDLPCAGKKIISRVAECCPIDRSPAIKGMPAENGVVRLQGDPYREFEWTEAVFLVTHKTKLSYTLSSPSRLSFDVRTLALMKAVQAASEWVIGTESNLMP